MAKDKRKAFVKEYVKDFNGTRAAIAAGYSENGAGVRAHELLKNSKIRAEIDAHLASLGWSEDNVKRELARIAFEGERDQDRIRALENIIKVIGMFAPEKVEEPLVIPEIRLVTVSKPQN